MENVSLNNPSLSTAMKPILILSCFACLLSTEAFSAEPKKPNVLFIAVDDLRPELGCYGKTWIKSPRLDKLASDGIVFRRAYCQQALCSPSRTSLLTGLRPDSTRVYDLQVHFRKNVPDVVTLPQNFKNHSYYTAAMGKIFHGDLDDPPSWSVPTWRGQWMRYIEPDNLPSFVPDVPGRQPQNQGAAWECADVADNAYPDGQITEHALAALRAVKDRPFFLAVGFYRPHLPFNAPKRYFDLYDPAEIRLANNPFPPKGATPYTLIDFGELRSYKGMPRKGPVSDPAARQLRHAYYACVSYIDAQIGMLLDELDRLGLRENTIVIVWGDHGWKLGEHASWCKHSNVENDTNAPLILRAPGFRGAGKADALVEFVDVYPTLCELAGLPLPKHLEGLSMVPLLRQPDRKWKSAAFSQYPRGGQVMGYSMRTDRYRFTRWVQGKNRERELAVELYDHQANPAENVNIARDAANAALVKQLTEQLKAGWRAAAKVP